MALTDDPTPRPADTVAALRAAGFAVDDVNAALRLAAHVVENTAYENAPKAEGDCTANLVMISAFLAAVADRDCTSVQEIQSAMRNIRLRPHRSARA